MVSDGEAALEFVNQSPPDVILMDIHMPRMDGFEATRRIMETRPIPIVVCSATANPQEVATTFRVLEAGALACVEKPVGREHPEFAQMAAHLRDTVKMMSEVKLVRRWPRAHVARTEAPSARPMALRPAVSYLFRSLADVYGRAAVGVLLTGMGRDGAAELKLMKDRGAITIAQDRDSSVVNGMPGEAIELGGATHVLPADKIADGLLSIVHRNNGAGA